MNSFYNEKLQKWWSGECFLERESGTLYGGITEEDAIAAGYVKKDRPTPEPCKPTDADNARTRMNEIEKELQSLDYLTSKEIDGEDMSEYKDYKSKRKVLRAEYRTLESKVKEG